MPVQRYKLTVAYRGTRYHGWQYQPMVPSYKGEIPLPGQGIPTIQEVMQRAMASVIRHPVKLSGSSRTDAGVHAKGQIIHFDTDQLQIPPEGMRQAINARLPEDILIRSIEPVDSTFDAVRSTVSKRYQYAIWNALDRPLFFADLAWHRWQRLDVAAMQEAARQLIGEHDFASFAKPGHGRLSTVRTLFDCSVAQRGARLIVGVEGSGFLWQMVRIIVGHLVETGMGRRDPGEIPQILADKDRRSAGPTAPPHGLYLQWIKCGEAESGQGSIDAYAE
jgi:tRNA pseudouridine38-40 synthase